MPASDSRPCMLVASEPTWGTPPAYTLTIAGGTPAGTFLLTVDGQPTSALAFGANAATVTAALVALSTVGAAGAVATGTIATGMTITFAGYRAALPVTLDATLITGGATSTLTGGPVWIFVKATKFSHDEKPAVQVPEELRNSPDPFYADAVVKGMEITEYSAAFGLRSDQVGHFLCNVGMTDSVATAGSVYTHTQKPSTGNGKSYSVLMYDGLTAFIGVGATGHEYGWDIKGGTNGEINDEWKATGPRAVIAATVPTFTLPSNTTYVRLGPHQSGTGVSIAGTTNASIQQAKLVFKREVTMLPQYGSLTPYRAEYKKRHLEFDLDLIYDSVTEATNALAAAPAAQAFVVTLIGQENISGGVYDQQVITVPKGLYTDLKVESGFMAPKLKLKGKTLYDTSTAAVVSVATKNATSAAY